MNDRKDHCGNSDTLLGFDFGARKIGVAIGDLESGVASPLETLAAVSQMPDWQNISDLINTWQPSGLVVGVSRQADGSDNPVTSRMLRFCRQLDGRYGLPVYQVDEFLTTFEAKQLLFDDTGVDASTLWKVQDSVAAQLILQTWLNENRRRTGRHD
ncbi:MAG: Holliday junction resolvase RuvX [Methylococcaceae bacterium]|nr:Holliday junction resolvase RuvX [Methylococcaceae bacterium]